MKPIGIRRFKRALKVAAFAGLSTAGGCKPFPTVGTVWHPISSSPPGATVFVDGKEEGKTPLNVLLTPATQHVVVVVRTGFQSVTAVIPVNAPQPGVNAVLTSLPPGHFGDNVVEGRPFVLASRDNALPAAPAVNNPVARRWLRMAQEEHASVASFARAAVELLQVGAPLELVAECERAARDEIEHARLCLQRACELEGVSLVLGFMPTEGPRTGGLVELMQRTFEEGCLNETCSAWAAAQALCHAHDDTETSTLQTIAEDETRHAQLAWRTLGWALSVGGEPVKNALTARINQPLAGHPSQTTIWNQVVRPLAASLLSA